MANLEDLPDFPAVRQLASALWKVGETRGAAVMIGAGFSSNAVLAAQNARKPPLWRDFSEEMNRRLYPAGGGPEDPLRLAEEYRAALGQPALEGLIFDLIRDTEWLPGAVHHKLLNLPWADVLTTNWDTLLERAAETNVHQSYEIVRAIADIPRTRAPRIVKLHGSMPSNRPFIFAEEDYRTYPTVFAPFVNFAQQVLLENELCLLGFSGDDPNFLHWSGWVRDQLGAAARRIHLVGVLNLSPARRKFLERRNVSAVDLLPLVKTLDQAEHHARALDLFIDYLAQAKPLPPHYWPPKKTKSLPAKSAESQSGSQQSPSDPGYLTQKMNAWREEREAYPGWLVCPFEKRRRVRFDTDVDSGFEAALKLLDANTQARAIYEVAWRLDVSLSSIGRGLREKIVKVVTESGEEVLEKRHLNHLGLILLRDAREQSDEKQFETWCGFVNSQAQKDKEVIAALTYERCLWLRDKLDYPKLSEMVKTFDGPEPAWKMRRAALHCELGEFDTARVMLNEVMRDLRDRYVRDRKSLWVLSRLAWATYFARALSFGSKQSRNPADPLLGDDWPTIFEESRCDPWDELQLLDSAVDDVHRERIKNALAKEARFEAGTYYDRSRTKRFISSSVVSPAYEVMRLADCVGLPGTADHVDIFGSRRRRAFELTESHDRIGVLTCIRVVRNHADDLVEKWFARVVVAQMPAEMVNELINLLSRLIDFGVQRFQRHDSTGFFWIEQVRLYTEILSRLVVRLSDKQAVDAFEGAVKYAKDQRWMHWWLFDTLGHLLQRSLDAVPPTYRKELAAHLVHLPLPDERGAPVEEHWPELAESFSLSSLVRPSNDPAFERRVGALIEKVQSADALSRSRAALRLTCLYEAGSLSTQESKAFGEALWSRCMPQGGFPSETNLLMHVFLSIPAPDENLPQILFGQAIRKELTKASLSGEFLTALVSASQAKRNGAKLFEIQKEDALLLFDAIVGWHPKDVEFDLGQVRLANEEIARAIGPLLADGILPVIDIDQLQGDRLEKIYSLVEGGQAPSSIVALPYTMHNGAGRTNRAVRLIHRALMGSDANLVYWAFRAISRWMKLKDVGGKANCPSELVHSVINAVITRRQPGLLHAIELAGDLVVAGMLDEEEKLRLADTLEMLHIETAYEHWSVQDPRTITLSLERAACVRLANKLMRSAVSHPVIEAWLNDAKIDPMPEVRYALTQ